MTFDLIYLYLFSPLHTGGASQEGNLVGIARESHTDLPYVPSSTIRGRLRAETDPSYRADLWGNTIEDVTDKGAENLKQGALWVGNASILWMPVPSLSHGVIWVTCPLLLQRWSRYQAQPQPLPPAYSSSLASEKAPIYLKDAILPASDLVDWPNWAQWFPQEAADNIRRVLVLPDQHCQTLVQMSLWRQVKIKLDEHKSVDGGFRYEEAIPPDTLMYFPWGLTAQTKSQEEGAVKQHSQRFHELIRDRDILQIGGQESLGRGFVQQWLGTSKVMQEVK
ncbi:MAG: type III-B CRISPR module RAMP protein Cmr4 [Synechococcales bacterium]|nr:type III-B CRISPR module RAMP protein Cmr4 [Synechococcales bacterium]